MYLIDSCYASNENGCYFRCMCKYTFDFAFEYQGEISQEYKILLVSNLRDVGFENPIVVSEGVIEGKKRYLLY